MAEDEKPEEPAKPDEGYGDRENTRIESIGEQIKAAKDEIMAAVKDLLGSRPKAEAEDGDGGIAGQMREALDILKRAERKREKPAEAAKPEPPAPEKPPKEYRKITTRLWGGDD